MHCKLSGEYFSTWNSFTWMRISIKQTLSGMGAQPQLKNDTSGNQHDAMIGVQSLEWPQDLLPFVVFNPLNFSSCYSLFVTFLWQGSRLFLLLLCPWVKSSCVVALHCRRPPLVISSRRTVGTVGNARMKNARKAVRNCIWSKMLQNISPFVDSDDLQTNSTTLPRIT